MPLYEFSCRDCKKSFEAARTIEDRNKPPECPRCKSAKNVERILSTFRAVTARKW